MSRTFGLRVCRFLQNISHNQPSIRVLFELVTNISSATETIAARASVNILPLESAGPAFAIRLRGILV